MNKIIKAITNNFWAKVVCILIATGLWMYVASGESKVDNFPGSINILVKNTPVNLVAIKDIDSVQLKIIADNGVWKKLSADTFNASIDLAGLNEGTYEVPVQVVSNIEGVQIVEITPATVMVRLEPLATKNVPVNVKTEGSAQEGYVVGEAITDPKEVIISGAKSVIDNISEATATVNLNNESDNIYRKSVDLFCYDKNNQIIRNIIISPTQANINLQIVKAAQSKTVGIKINTIGNPQAGYWVSQISSDPATVSIIGSANVLSRTEYIETEPISIENISNNKTTTANLKLPLGISLAGGQKSQILAKVSVSAPISSKDVNAKINFNNLTDNLRVSNTDPSTVKITLSGTTDQLQKISQDNVILNLDMSGHSSGTFIINIDSNMISVPDNIEVINFLPTSVKITLENK